MLWFNGRSSFAVIVIFINSISIVEAVSEQENGTKTATNNRAVFKKVKEVGHMRKVATDTKSTSIITPSSEVISPVKYKLTYFNGRGRAEVIRLLFAQANVSYDDIRINQQEWPALKPKMPYGQLPVLNVDGKTLAQSHAIEKFLARKFDLLGSNDWEAAKIDELILGLEDLTQKMLPWIHEANDTKKIDMFKVLVKDEINPFLQRYEQFLKNSGTGYFVGNSLSVADLAVFNMLQFFDGKLMPGHLKKYPNLNEFVARVQKLPNIKAWIEKRPKTTF